MRHILGFQFLLLFLIEASHTKQWSSRGDADFVALSSPLLHTHTEEGCYNFAFYIPEPSEVKIKPRLPSLYILYFFAFMYACTHVCMCRHFNAVVHGEKPVYFVDFL